MLGTESVLDGIFSHPENKVKAIHVAAVVTEAKPAKHVQVSITHTEY